jgi:hypothetical protein
MFPVRPEDVVSVLDLVDYRGELSLQSFIQPDAEDLADAFRRQPPQTDLATAPEDLAYGEMTFENEVPAVLDMSNRIEPRQAHPAALFLENFGPRMRVR